LSNNAKNQRKEIKNNNIILTHNKINPYSNINLIPSSIDTNLLKSNTDLFEKASDGCNSSVIETQQDVNYSVTEGNNSSLKAMQESIEYFNKAIDDLYYKHNDLKSDTEILMENNINNKPEDPTEEYKLLNGRLEVCERIAKDMDSSYAE